MDCLSGEEMKAKMRQLMCRALSLSSYCTSLVCGMGIVPPRYSVYIEPQIVTKIYTLFLDNNSFHMIFSIALSIR